MFTKTTCVFCCALILIIQTSNARPKLTNEDRTKIGDHCVKQTGVERTLIERTVKTTILPMDEKYREYLVCSYRLQGYMHPTTSQMLHENIADFLKDYYSTDELVYIMKECREIQNEVAHEAAYKTVQCLLNKFKDVDVIRKNELNENIVD